jgi:hypothetical protein
MNETVTNNSRYDFNPEQQQRKEPATIIIIENYKEFNHDSTAHLLPFFFKKKIGAIVQRI